jgi:hypothetical protein
MGVSYRRAVTVIHRPVNALLGHKDAVYADTKVDPSARVRTVP